MKFSFSNLLLLIFYINLAKQYYVKLYTGNKQDINGTDMNISIRMFGDFEVSKEEKLIFTKTHEHKFNKNQVTLEN